MSTYGVLLTRKTVVFSLLLVACGSSQRTTEPTGEALSRVSAAQIPDMSLERTCVESLRLAEIESGAVLWVGIRSAPTRETVERWLEAKRREAETAVAAHRKAMRGATSNCRVANLIRIGDVNHCQAEKIVEVGLRSLSMPLTEQVRSNYRNASNQTLAPYRVAAETAWAEALSIAVVSDARDPWLPLARDRSQRPPVCKLD